jgi:hypothetical protein
MPSRRERRTLLAAHEREWLGELARYLLDPYDDGRS